MVSYIETTLTVIKALKGGSELMCNCQAGLHGSYTKPETISEHALKEVEAQHTCIFLYIIILHTRKDT